MMKIFNTRKLNTFGEHSPEQRQPASRHDATSRRWKSIGAICFPAALSLALLFPVHAVGQQDYQDDGQWCAGTSFGHTFPLHRVSARANSWCLGNSYNGVFNRSDNSVNLFDNVSNGNARDMYIGLQQNPTYGDTDMLVMSFAGQRPTLDNGIYNRFTGQRDGYRFNCADTTQGYTTHGDAFAPNLYANSWINLENPGRVHVAHVFDATSNYLSSQNHKSNVVHAFKNYVTDRMQGNKKLITLTGSSRGACVAYNMAIQLKAEPAFEDVPMILLLADPVCNPGESEDGDISPNDAEAPQPSSGAGNFPNDRVANRAPNDTNFTDQAKKSLSMYITITGDNVVVNGARGFVDDKTPYGTVNSSTFERVLTTSIGATRTWYKHQWVNHSHPYLGRTCGSQNLIDVPMQDWWDTAAAQFYCRGSAFFDPEIQECNCPAGEYYSWAQGPNQHTCVPVPDCDWDQVAVGDPQVCDDLCPSGCQIPEFTMAGDFAYCKDDCGGGMCDIPTGECLFDEDQTGTDCFDPGPCQDPFSNVCSDNATVSPMVGYGRPPVIGNEQARTRGPGCNQRATCEHRCEGSCTNDVCEAQDESKAN
jgi:hypothetical protein